MSKKAARRTGRPALPPGEARDRRIELRVTRAEKRTWTLAADARGVEVSELVRRAVAAYLGA